MITCCKRHGVEVASTATNLYDYKPFFLTLPWMNMNMMWTPCNLHGTCLCKNIYDYLMNICMMPSVLAT